MNTQKDYDVLRLIEHNRICYVSSDNVRGAPLVYWIKYHPYLEKEQMIYWIYIIIQQLAQIHKCRGNPCYQYVNPYSIIVTEDQKLCFLDIGADSNKERIRLMQRRNKQLAPHKVVDSCNACKVTEGVTRKFLHILLIVAGHQRDGNTVCKLGEEADHFIVFFR